MAATAIPTWDTRTMDTKALKAQIVVILTGDAGMTPEAVADAIVAAVLADLTPVAADPNAVQPTAEGSRDETHDSIDPNTGTLTADAVAKRAADVAQVASDEADVEAAAAEEEAAAAEEAGDETALAAAKDKLTAAQTKKAAAAEKLAQDQGTLAADDGPETTSDPVASDTKVDPAVGNVTTAADLQG